MDRFLDGVISGIINGKRSVYNPALFYGETFVTKEVIDRLIKDYRAAHPYHKVVQISSEEFFRQLIRSIKDNNDLDFGKQFDYTNLLVFENVEEIAGKMATMQAFYGVFDKVYESGGQIVLTSSAPPSKIITLEDRVRTQLEGGIMCKVNAKSMDDHERITITGIMASNPDAPSDEFRVEFYPDGKVKKVGYAVKAGLCEGKVYYPSGNIQYEGSFFKKGDLPGSDYYGPTYPTTGKFYAENGELIYEGQAKTKRIGNASWPVVVFPEGFDNLHG